MGETGSAAREGIFFGATERNASAGSSGDDELAGGPSRASDEPRIGDAEERLVAMVNVLVVGIEGGAVEPAKENRRPQKTKRHVKLGPEDIGDPDARDGAKLRDVKALVVQLRRFGALATNRSDVRTIFGMHHPERGAGQVQRERDFARP